ncbi:MAG: hypothetical protein KA436_08430, partial [Oligoflexales bacterium]|nr:hypothetical protein [Oligoflexales bacterium]
MENRFLSFLSAISMILLMSSCKSEKKKAPAARATQSTTSSQSNTLTGKCGTNLFGEGDFKPDPAPASVFNLSKNDIKVGTVNKGPGLNVLQVDFSFAKSGSGYLAWQACSTETKECTNWKKEYRASFDAIGVPPGNVNLNFKHCFADRSFLVEADRPKFSNCNSNSTDPSRWCCGTGTTVLSRIDSNLDHASFDPQAMSCLERTSQRADQYHNIAQRMVATSAAHLSSSDVHSLTGARKTGVVTEVAWKIHRY